ncbi:MAG: hypothetical protein U0235_19215 [Polyangiaceae bacterium]
MKERVSLALAALALSGCAGWTRVLAGPAYNAQGRDGKNGPFVGVDALLTPRPHSFLNASSKPLPVAFHTGLESQIMPDAKTFAWTTGIAALGKPRPVSGYAMAGTNLHVDYIDGRMSLGNFQPYGEAGVAAQLSQTNEEEDRGFIFTFGFGASYWVHYASLIDKKGPLTDTFLQLKFGLGYELY